jgi:MinD-like ATPase involved in chromosome partitioning or flagellar assembly
VHFTDGFDRPDTIALGLDAPRLIAVVSGALCAYAVMQAPLPLALRVGVAVLVALASAVLGWARYAGRPVLSWAWLALRFVLSPRSGGDVAVRVGAASAAASEPVAAAPELARTSRPELAPNVAPEPACDTAPEQAEAAAPPNENGVPVWAQWLRFEAQPEAPPADVPPPPDVVETAREAPLVVVMDEAPTPAQGEPDAAEDTEPAPAEESQPEPAEVLQLPLPRPALDIVPAPPPVSALDAPPLDAAPPPVFVGAPRRLTFFSLNGGSGRTTLATEVACLLAARGRHLAADGTVRPLDVALLDLDLRSATVSVRLGIPQPTLADYVARGSDPAHLDACMVRHSSGVRALLGMPKPVGTLEPARVAEIIHQLERDGVQFVVIDVAGDLDAVTTWVLSAAHDVFVVLTPTASGVQDAYRTTAALRRLGLAHKLRYVVNRARGSLDLHEVMGDLGGRVCAVIPYDPAVEDAENHHRIVALDGEGPAAAALHDLAALLYPTLSSAARRTRMSWLRWRRRAG